MNIQSAALESGLSADTIRYYERARVLPLAPRRPNGYRDYTDAHLATLRLARGLRELDVPLADVAAVLSVAHDGECSDVKSALTERLDTTRDTIDARIRHLKDTRLRITELTQALRAMPDDQGPVPGVDACGCVSTVGEFS